MRHPRSTDETLELATLYTLGALPPEPAAAFEAHLAEGCPACEGEVKAFAVVVGQLGHIVTPQRPRAEVRSRLLARLRSDAGPDAQRGERSEATASPAHPDWTIVRATEGVWEPWGMAGLLVKRLFRDPTAQRFTALVRMAAGARYPSHRHTDTEELYLLEGDLAVGGQSLRAGDYCAATAGTVHGSSYSEQGCRFLLMASERDEVIEGERTAAPHTDGRCHRQAVPRQVQHLFPLSRREG
jgi:anti-sigma factor ChrR (cupin superfamily)